VHFKELFILDNKESDIKLSDIERRNAIAILLEEWGLLNIINKPKTNAHSELSQIKIVSYKEKNEWNLIPKYNIGIKRKVN
jgi:hypothetical protein